MSVHTVTRRQGYSAVREPVDGRLLERNRDLREQAEAVVRQGYNAGLGWRQGDFPQAPYSELSIAATLWWAGFKCGYRARQTNVLDHHFSRP